MRLTNAGSVEQWRSHQEVQQPQGSASWCHELGGTVLDTTPATKEQTMLVLTRKVDESIMIGDNIKITLIDIRNNTARLGIDAPKDVRVHREEIWKLIQSEGQTETPGTANR